MVSLETPVCEFNKAAVDFSLPGVDGKDWSLAECAGEKGLLVMFICNHCPYVIHVNDELIRLCEDYKNLGIGFVAISPNDVENYPQDGPDKMKIHAEKIGYNFPYLYDESQDIAKAYDAACTPDLYVFDKSNKLFYRGRIDDARPGTGKEITGVDIRNAIDSMIKGGNPPEIQYPSGGCNIKWKK